MKALNLPSKIHAGIWLWTAQHDTACFQNSTIQEKTKISKTI